MLKKTLAALLIAAAFTGVAQAQLKYQEGTDYSVLATTLDQDEANKTIEFFWYGCPHCYHMEPALQEWLASGKNTDQVEKIPAVTPNWEGGAYLFYTLRELGMNAKEMDQKIFDAFHKDKNRAIIFKKDAAIEFLVKNGADKEKAEKAWESLAVKQKVKHASNLFEATKLDGVPGFVVAGKYLVGGDGDYPRLFDKLNTLAAKRTPAASMSEGTKSADATAKSVEEAKPAENSSAEAAKPSS